jgi:DNA-binding transcriptional MerR regulator
MSPDALIPKRALFKPAEVCSIAGVKPYILRSWEAEFQTLGRGSKTAGARVYRRADVEMVLRIKDLVFSEGLTLGAARRKIEGEAKPGPSGAEQELLGDLFGADARERLGQVKEGLRSILELLSESGEAASDSVGDRVDAVPVSQARKTKKAARPVASTKKAASRKPKKKSA